MDEFTTNGKGRITLKEYFEADKMPTEGEFNDLINSSLNKKDDQLFINPKGADEKAARYLGIGSTDPQSPLSIRNRTGDEKLIGLENTGGEEEWYVGINPTAGDNGIIIQNNDNPDAQFIFNADGKMGIGTKKPEEKLHVTGKVKAQQFEGKVSWSNLIDMPNSLVPQGVIVMWSGTVDKIPESWLLCDGQSGTPDLRDRFIAGAGNSYNPGDTGGMTHVKLTADESGLQSHNHTISDPGHAHNYSDLYSPQDSGVRYKGGSERPINWLAEAGRTTSGAGTGITINATEARSANDAHENRPPYFALCFIMKQ